MKTLMLDEIIVAIGGRPLGMPPAANVTDVCIDSRKLTPKCLFFAIRGETHDGHDFVSAAIEGGASAAVISDTAKIDPALHRDGRLIQVADTTAALGRLAGWYRKQLAAQVIAVAGSNGKTTTKNMLTTVLASRRRGRGAAASFNNAIGVPLTLLAAEPADEFVVVEIGTNHPGEVVALGRIARPNLAIITSIGEEHLEFFRDLDTVAKEEFSLLGCLRDHGFVAVSHEAAKYAAPELLRAHSAVIYGTAADAHLRAERLTCENGGYRFLLNGRKEFFVPMLGAHNAMNALGVIAVATRMRLTEDEIAAALATVRPAPMRLEWATIGGLTLINDAYNANPSSMRAALSVIDELSGTGRKVLILGDMRELGDTTERAHLGVGRDAGRSAAQVIITVGENARVVADGVISTAGAAKRVYSFPSVATLVEKLESLIEPGDVVLLKASRASKLEQIVPHLEAIGRLSPTGAS